MTRSTGKRSLHVELESIYGEWNRAEYIHPDPLESISRYQRYEDREVAGLIAATLAYGNVIQILRSVNGVMEQLGPTPADRVRGAPARYWSRVLSGFRHRWTTGAEVASLFAGVGRVLDEYGSLERCFLEHHMPDSGSTLAGLDGLVRALRNGSARNSLLSDPVKGSACKRLHLYLRWMVRRDAVDPGVWTGVSPAHLIVPLDTHMHRAALALGLTRRKSPGLATALEITRSFATFVPHDPLRYDFAITRFGIRKDLDFQDFLERFRAKRAVAASP